MPCLRVKCTSYLFTLASLYLNEYFHAYAIIQLLANCLVFLIMVIYKLNKNILVTREIKIIYKNDVIRTTVHIKYYSNPYYVRNAATHMGPKYSLLYLFRDTDLHRLPLVSNLY